MLKATIASVLTLAAAVAASGCSGKTPEQQQSAAAPAASAPATPSTVPANHPAAKPAATVDVSNIAKAEGGKTVAEVYADKDKLAGSKVTVRGKVVKLNRGIMGKDWLHLRDGSGADGSNDLTVTTTAKTLPNVGDVVVIVGSVATNKDYGMGYNYPVIVEDATVTIEAAPAQ